MRRVEIAEGSDGIQGSSSVPQSLATPPAPIDFSRPMGTAPAAAGAGRVSTVSANIRPKKRVASLLGGP